MCLDLEVEAAVLLVGEWADLVEGEEVVGGDLYSGEGFIVRTYCVTDLWWLRGKLSLFS